MKGFRVPQNTFDLARCTRCMLCVEICPLRIIEKDSETGFPSIVDARSAACVRCGHCESACPEAAVTVDHPTLQLPPQVGDGTIGPDRFLAYCVNRRSIRKYRQDDVDRASLERLLDIARYAPTAVNRQPVQWTVVHGHAKVNELGTAMMLWIEEAEQQRSPLAARMNFGNLLRTWRETGDTICRGAPALIVAHANAGDRMAQGDATIALSHIELAAPAFGLGGCWAGYFTIVAGAAPALRAKLGLADDQAVLGTMMLGIPALRYPRVPKRNIARINWR